MIELSCGASFQLFIASVIYLLHKIWINCVYFFSVAIHITNLVEYGVHQWKKSHTEMENITLIIP